MVNAGEIDGGNYVSFSCTILTSPIVCILAVKIPQVITHEKVLVDCEPEFDEFIERMHLLGRRSVCQYQVKASLGAEGP